jgi:hypothetical protein
LRTIAARAEHVPFRLVSLPDGSPKKANCNANVDSWVATIPVPPPVRGWLFHADFQIMKWLTAHSVVRDVDGQLFDITPIADERVRPVTRFVPHLGDEQGFLRMRKLGNEIYCPSEEQNAGQ